MAGAEDIRFSFDCELPEDMNLRADRDLKLSQATGCRLSRKYVMETYGVELEEPQEPTEPQFGAPNAQPFSDAPQRRDAAARMATATIERMCDDDAFGAWRLPIENAARRVFGDLDPNAEDLPERFRERAPEFLASLPGILDHITPDDFCDALRGGMMAAFLNFLNPNFTSRRATPK